MSFLPTPIANPLDNGYYTVPDWIQSVIEWVVGMEFPEGDEAAMRELADEWYAASAELGPLLSTADSDVRAAVAAFGGPQGDVAAAIQELWHVLGVGETAALEQIQQWLHDMGEWVDTGANEIEAVKIEFYVELGLLIIELLAIAATAFFTFGASTAAAAPAMAASRYALQLAIRKAARELLERTVKKGIVGEFKHKLKDQIKDKVKSKAGRTLLDLADDAAEEALQEGLTSLGTQAYQVSSGNRQNLDWGDIGTSSALGALGGGVAGLAGLGHGANGWLKYPEKLARGAGGEILAEVSIGLVTGQGVSLSSLGMAATSGGFGGITGAVHHAVDTRGLAVLDTGLHSGGELSSPTSAAFDTSGTGSPLDIPGTSPIAGDVSDAADSPDHPDLGNLPQPSGTNSGAPPSMTELGTTEHATGPTPPGSTASPDSPPTHYGPVPSPNANLEGVATADPVSGTGQATVGAGIGTTQPSTVTPGGLTGANAPTNSAGPVIAPAGPVSTPPNPAPGLGAVSGPGMPSPGPVTSGSTPTPAGPGTNPQAAAQTPGLSPAGAPPAQRTPTTSGAISPPGVTSPATAATGSSAPATPRATVPNGGASAERHGPVPTGGTPKDDEWPAALLPELNRRATPVAPASPTTTPPGRGKRPMIADNQLERDDYASEVRYGIRQELRRRLELLVDTLLEQSRLNLEQLNRDVEDELHNVRNLADQHPDLRPDFTRLQQLEDQQDQERRRHADLNKEGILALRPGDLDEIRQELFAIGELEHLGSRFRLTHGGLIDSDPTSRLTGHGMPPPVEASRRYGQPGGHRPPLALHQQDLELEVERDEDGRPSLFPNLFGKWLRLVNDGGPDADPTRGINCVDVVLSVTDTWMHGRPRVAAPRTIDAFTMDYELRPIGGERGGAARIQQVVGGQFQRLMDDHRDSGLEATSYASRQGLHMLEQQLSQAGPGAMAILIRESPDGTAHATTVHNQDGQILYVDAQDPHNPVTEYRPCGATRMDAILIGPDGVPRDLGTPAGFWSNPRDDTSDLEGLHRAESAPGVDPTVMIRDADDEQLRELNLGSITVRDLGFADITDVPPSMLPGIEAALPHATLADPAQLKFSQRSVSPSTSDDIPADVLVRNMREGGWQGPPIHVVRFGDGSLVTVDHRRLRAAQLAGLEQVPIVVHQPSEPVASWPTQFTPRYLESLRLANSIYATPDGRWVTDPAQPVPDRPVFEAGAIPKTWAEYAVFRAADQRSQLPGSLFGTDTPPVILDRLPPPVPAPQLAEQDQTVLRSLLERAEAAADRAQADLLDAARSVEPSIRPYGLDHRVKSFDSLARKYVDEAVPEQIPVEDFAAEVNDTLRFSLVMPEGEAYLPAVQETLEAMRQRGYTVAGSVKNFWVPGNRHFGVNATLVTPDGLQFEVQFPTELTVEMGRRTHEFYEIIRQRRELPPRRVHALLRMLSINKELGLGDAIPAGVSEEYGVKPAGFADWIAQHPKVWRDYQAWLELNQRGFGEIVAEFDLDRADFPISTKARRGLSDAGIELLRHLPEGPQLDGRTPAGEPGGGLPRSDGGLGLPRDVVGSPAQGLGVQPGGGIEPLRPADGRLRGGGAAPGHRPGGGGTDRAPAQRGTEATADRAGHLRPVQPVHPDDRAGEDLGRVGPGAGSHDAGGLRAPGSPTAADRLPGHPTGPETDRPADPGGLTTPTLPGGTPPTLDLMMGDATAAHLGRLGVGTAALADLGYADLSEVPSAQLESIKAALPRTAMLPPTDLLFTQRSAEPAIYTVEQSDGTTITEIHTAVEIETDLALDGWKGRPVHAVRWGNGNLAGLDTEQLRAAQRAGLDAIPVAVHLPTERLDTSPEYADPATLAGLALTVDIRQLPDGTLAAGGSDGTIVYPKGQTPQTWGELALFRAADQRSLLPGDLYGTSAPPMLLPSRTAPAPVLSEQVAAQLETMHDELVAAADRMQGQLTGLVAGLDFDVELVGDGPRVESLDQIQRYWSEEARQFGADVDTFREFAPHLVQFTVRLPDGSAYTEALGSRVSQLRLAGFEITDELNLWQPGNPVQGIELTVRDAAGNLAQIILPTARSLLVEAETRQFWEIANHRGEHPARRVHAMLQAIAANLRHDDAGSVPPGVTGRPIDQGVSYFISTFPDEWADYRAWLDYHDRGFTQILAEFGLTAADLRLEQHLTQHTEDDHAVLRSLRPSSGLGEGRAGGGDSRDGQPLRIGDGELRLRGDALESQQQGVDLRPGRQRGHDGGSSLRGQVHSGVPGGGGTDHPGVHGGRAAADRGSDPLAVPAEGQPSPTPELNPQDWSAVDHLLPRVDSGTHREAAEDDSYQVVPKDVDLVGLSPQAVLNWAARLAPLGMDPDGFLEFQRSLAAALATAGVDPAAVDVRLLGSSATFFSGAHKKFPTEQDSPRVAEQLASWYPPGTPRPPRRQFDLMHTLGLEPERSDYDLHLASDEMVSRAKVINRLFFPDMELWHPKYAFVRNPIVEMSCPPLHRWAREERNRLGREVGPRLFASSGPPDSGEISSHFRDSDWRLNLLSPEADRLARERVAVALTLPELADMLRGLRTGQPTKIDPDELIRRMAQLPDSADLLLEVPRLRQTLTARPTTLYNNLRYPQAIAAMQQVIDDLQLRGAAEVAAQLAGEPAPTPLRPRHLDISERARAKIAPDATPRQPGFDASRLTDTEYQRDYLKSLYQQSVAAQAELVGLASEVTAGIPATIHERLEPKDETRSMDKIRKYSGHADKLTDLAGVLIRFANLDELYHGLARLVERDDVELVFFDDRFQSPEPGGYRDIQTRIRTSSGHVGELRLHLRSIDDVADWEHKLYEIRRDIAALAEEDGRDLTLLERAIVERIKREQQTALWRGLLTGIIDGEA